MENRSLITMIQITFTIVDPVIFLWFIQWYLLKTSKRRELQNSLHSVLPNHWSKSVAGGLKIKRKEKIIHNQTYTYILTYAQPTI